MSTESRFSEFKNPSGQSIEALTAPESATKKESNLPVVVFGFLLGVGIILGSQLYLDKNGGLWKTGMSWLGVDIDEYREDRRERIGSDEDYSDNNWEDDMKMMINDGLMRK